MSYMIQVDPYVSMPESNADPNHASQHIQYELAKFAIGMLSEEDMVHDRIRRVLGVMSGKCLIDSPRYDLDFDGRLLLLEWNHARDGREVQVMFEIDDLNFEMAKRLEAVFWTMVT